MSIYLLMIHRQAPYLVANLGKWRTPNTIPMPSSSENLLTDGWDAEGGCVSLLFCLCSLTLRTAPCVAVNYIPEIEFLTLHSSAEQMKQINAT